MRAVLATGTVRQQVLIRYRGGHTRHYPKKSYEIRIGNRSIHYNAEYDDPSMLRNAFSFRFFESIGVPSPRTRHVKLVINGVPQGTYLEIEGVDTTFFRKRKVRLAALLYAINNNANFRLLDEHNRSKRSLSSGYEAVVGGRTELSRMAGFVKSLNKAGRKELPAYLQSRLNISQYLKWLSGAVCTGNYDGFDQNYALYRTAGSLKYHISPWDYEGSWGRDCYGETVPVESVRITGYNGLTETLLSYPDIRKQYRRTLRSVLDTAFTPGVLIPAVTGMFDRLMPELAEDPTRKHSVSAVRADLEVFTRYIRRRRAYLYSKLDKLS